MTAIPAASLCISTAATCWRIRARSISGWITYNPLLFVYPAFEAYGGKCLKFDPGGRMMKTLSIRAAVSLCAPLLLTFTSPHVVAQTTNEAGARQLEEIVVRAQKKSRAEDLQEVPASITAFNELQLDRI